MKNRTCMNCGHWEKYHLFNTGECSRCSGDYPCNKFEPETENFNFFEQEQIIHGESTPAEIIAEREKPQKSCGKCKPDENCLCKEFKLKPIVFNNSPQNERFTKRRGKCIPKQEGNTPGSEASGFDFDLSKKKLDNQELHSGVGGLFYSEDIKEFIKISLNDIETSPRIVNENDLQKMEYIELSYSGDLIPVEAVGEILMRRAGDELLK